MEKLEYCTCRLCKRLAREKLAEAQAEEMLKKRDALFPWEAEEGWEDLEREG